MPGWFRQLRAALHLRGGSSTRAQFAPPPPQSPLEVGLALRTRREELGLSLETVRSETGVPLVDLESLERGVLEPFHLEAAAIVAVFRYAQVLGLDPEPLAAVLRRHWPRRATGVDALSSADGFGPVAHLRAATGAIDPLVGGRVALESGAPLGLAESTVTELHRNDLSANATIALLVGTRSNPEPEALEAAPTPAGELEAAPDPAGELEAAPDPAGELEAAAPTVEEAGASGTSHGLGRLAHTLAERFGVDGGAPETPEPGEPGD